MLIKSTGKLITTAHAPKHECAFIALIVYTVLKGIQHPTIGRKGPKISQPFVNILPNVAKTHLTKSRSCLKPIPKPHLTVQ
ncbi:hypothetical protein M8J75_004062 [Diaphorina citri]|nr:hypothetical protein M8J75_004062 [Diaphorina citri]